MNETSPATEAERAAFEAETAHMGLDYEPAGLVRKSEGCTYWQATTEAAFCAWRRIAARPVAAPLTDERIDAIANDCFCQHNNLKAYQWRHFARALLAEQPAPTSGVALPREPEPKGGA